MSRILAIRLDSDGDVVLTGPALRALRSTAQELDLLVSPAGEQAAHLLPAVDRVQVFAAPWSGYSPPPVDPAAVTALLDSLRAGRYDRAVIFTSFHQSPLPMALLAKMAGIGWIGATSEDYPGSLLDLRHTRAGGHEVEAALDLARACGGELPPGDDGRLALRRPLAVADHLVPADAFLVVHPTASVPARSLLPAHARALVDRLTADGWPVAVTGGPGDSAAAAAADCAGATDLSGRTTLAELAAVVDRAACVVSVNTAPAHLAAAVNTPVVSLFAPVVPAERWAPYGVPSVVLGNQGSACRDSRARECPVPGHPCLTEVSPDEVSAAVVRLTAGAARLDAALAATGGRP